DLSRLVAGNLLTQHLADFGADVIKVEPREGDTLRGWRINNIETTWKVHSRNKRSLCVEFRHDEAVPLIRKLIPGAAMLIENYRLTGKTKPRSGSRSSGSVPRNVYRTLDGGWVCLSASTQGMAMRVLRSIGRPELCEDPHFKSNEQRLIHVVELDKIIGDFVG